MKTIIHRNIFLDIYRKIAMRIKVQFNISLVIYIHGMLWWTNEDIYFTSMRQTKLAWRSFQFPGQIPLTMPVARVCRDEVRMPCYLYVFQEEKSSFWISVSLVIFFSGYHLRKNNLSIYIYKYKYLCKQNVYNYICLLIIMLT